jgi:predicted nucleic acid-binding protein
MSETENLAPLCFVDTNIWLYAFIASQDATKSTRAKQLLQENATSIVVSSQVINEVCVNLLRKGRVSETNIEQLVRSFYHKYPVVMLDEAVQVTASQLRERLSLSFWDSLIVSAALHGRATTLYTEDMQAGLIVNDQLTIHNPFAATISSFR